MPPSPTPVKYHRIQLEVTMRLCDGCESCLNHQDFFIPRSLRSSITASGCADVCQLVLAVN